MFAWKSFSLAGVGRRVPGMWGAGESEINEAERSVVRGWGEGRSPGALRAIVRNLGVIPRGCGKLVIRDGPVRFGV